MQPYGFVYMWINKITDKKYIGSHYGTENDRYIGSGLHFKRAYNKNQQNFYRIILEYVYDKQVLLMREQYYLDLVNDIQNNKNYYNTSPNSSGGYNHGHLSEKRKKQIYDNWILSSLEARKNMTVEQREILKNKKQNSWKNNNEVRNRHSINTQKRRLLEEENKTEEEKLKFKQKCKELYSKKTNEQLKIIAKKKSDSVKKWHDSKSIELEKQRIENMKKTKKLKKLKYIHDDNSIKQVPEIELSLWLNNGWKLGMGKRSSF